MIVANLENLPGQLILTPGMERALTFLRQPGKSELPDGQVVIDGRDVYAEVQSYDTLDGEISAFEGHRQYIDLQYVVDGKEIIAWASTDQVAVTTPYDSADDYWLGTAPPDQVTLVRLSAGQLAVLYPDDAHAPRRAAGAPSRVKKIVVKVAVGR